MTLITSYEKPLALSWASTVSVTVWLALMTITAWVPYELPPVDFTFSALREEPMEPKIG